jgi:hypothetical protein
MHSRAMFSNAFRFARCRALSANFQNFCALSNWTSTISGGKRDALFLDIINNQLSSSGLRFVKKVGGGR